MINRIQAKIEGLVEKFMHDYAKCRVIDKIKMFEYPKKDVVIDVLEKLQIVIYPGYYTNSNYRAYTIKNNVAVLLEDITHNLIEQIAIVLR